MISEDWLCAYRDIEMIGYGLSVISKRLSRPEGLDGLFEHLEGNYELLSADFSDFYPALQAFTRVHGDAKSCEDAGAASSLFKAELGRPTSLDDLGQQ